ncbi:hypothetical protein ZHAS_00009451 [Anopheles sinensis]|uniref:Uncharacterized protein n=1 Tax=Anopheles sinensis TaxID=74873 RepID=A0A084VV98_ANOSI|nr:hypothetical protein ZHAS_00009451 [Anopheles sinensis]
MNEDERCHVEASGDGERNEDSSSGDNVSVTIPEASTISNAIDCDGSNLSPGKSSISVVSLRSWTASIGTASSEDLSYDNYTDDDDEGAGSNRRFSSGLSTSPFDLRPSGACGRARAPVVVVARSAKRWRSHRAAPLPVAPP